MLQMLNLAMWAKLIHPKWGWDRVVELVEISVHQGVEVTFHVHCVPRSSEGAL